LAGTGRRLTWASCCSGSEVIRFVMDVVNTSLSEVGTSFRHSFSCESSEDKRKWISLVNHLGSMVTQQHSSHLDASESDSSTIASDSSPCESASSPDQTQSDPACDACGSNEASGHDSASECKAASGHDDLDAADAPCAPCIFQDICELGATVADCWQHGKKCPVPSVDLLVLGTSCKDFSRANSQLGDDLMILDS
jgi:hypothetical protein